MQRHGRWMGYWFTEPVMSPLQAPRPLLMTAGNGWPDPDGTIEAIIDFASTYNAYERWADEPDHLEALLAPVLAEWDRAGTIPAWAGTDTLRALLFLEQRSDYFDGGSTQGERRMREVYAKLQAHGRWR
jgi:hypothetical protein